MAFNSLIFLIFLFLFFLGWQFVKTRKLGKWVFLCLMSLVFYAWWDWRFVFLILFSGLLDFLCGHLMEKRPGSRKLWLWISLVGNIGSLSVFKYSYWFLETINAISERFNCDFELIQPSFSIILPVGISFYTFQSMSYTLDVYYRRLKPVKNFFLFFSYLSLFPQLVAGPIIRAKDLLKQLVETRLPSRITVYHGLKLIAYGFFQKMVLADNFGYMVDRVFQQKTIHTGTPMWWVTMVIFSFQIYFDFGGYSLIARGLAKLMGLHFRMNFNHPYTAVGFKDFWSKWHISLSTWFRDYVYIPLGGNRNGFIWSNTYMIITMIVSGLWHGANWTFILWGLLHGLYLAGERILKKSSLIPPTELMRFTGWVLTYIMVVFAWVFFRADSLEMSVHIIKNMTNFDMNWSFINEFFNAEFWLIIAVLIELYWFLKHYSLTFFRLTKNRYFELVKIPTAFAFAVFFRGPEESFIYFQF